MRLRPLVFALAAAVALPAVSFVVPARTAVATAAPAAAPALAAEHLGLGNLAGSVERLDAVIAGP
ncbi:recombinase A [Oceanicola granulosus HTCC2516]|uniref:Recombinase A n=1 Tax=Oceanicola granulosus (strain ATCC BAA-861 / DSM 15982 / KCTC 12143 / HTCC2516) TaxID=314256 RepID=Q2C9X4_OCEGH|nr:hypothetical protein [Oceanicola granulosus]EAR49466.1 recombinase A [Oceanicola granulosus HTCC2516]